MMIELSQPAQCLFCPQRRKIALLLKLVMAASTAIIMALILFQPGTRRVVAPTDTSSGPDTVPASNVGSQILAKGRPGRERNAAREAVSERGAEIRAQAHQRFQVVQAQLRPLLSEDTLQLARAQKLLEERRREILKTKLLTLGEDLFAGSGQAEGERKQVLDALEKELNVLAEQRKLLSELKGSD
ncbi:MAG: hypothetical protein L0312_05095 [Acidobacteria bacterium]|nr:hypothetical protein [Acidobacteriota bacterium]MCI0721265.1 hypothetical protein [Acidobacteriota bacterium]